MAEQKTSLPNSTFASRAASTGKKVGPAENEQVQTSDAESKSLDDMSKDELYELATQRDIEGRSSMSKTELLDALKD